jgi:biotin transporter BioY
LTARDYQLSLRRIYFLTLSLALLGVIGFTAFRGYKAGLAFLCGAAISFLNLWLFDWIAHGIVPDTGEPKTRRAGTFISRYLVLFLFGYATVNTLGLDALAVVSGLLASTAAVLLASVFELAHAVTGKPSSH